jgi:hypothetical protein
MPYTPRADRVRGSSGTEPIHSPSTISKNIVAQRWIQCYKKSMTVPTDLSGKPKWVRRRRSC